MSPRALAAGAVLACALAPPAAADAVPYFARRYGVTCGQCHVAPPKLNQFGEAFVAAGYAAPSLEPRRTWPLAVWASVRTERLPGEVTADPYVNRVELISGGRLRRALWYFVEWRPVSLEARADATLRDRSGRFEDLFATWSDGRWEATVGQFRQIAQVDVSRRLGLSEPLVLGSGLPGVGGGTARERALRGFAPAGRSPALRLAWNRAGRSGLRWTFAAAVPVPGELSLPLSDEARVEASNELELTPKGLVVEAFARRGLASFGLHAFYDHAERYLANAVVTGRAGPVYWTGVAGAVRTAGVLRGQWSLEAELVPQSALGAGVRFEDRAADGLRAAVVPYLNGHLPGTRYTVRLTLERRVQSRQDATLLELAVVF